MITVHICMLIMMILSGFYIHVELDSVWGWAMPVLYVIGTIIFYIKVVGPRKKAENDRIEKNYSVSDFLYKVDFCKEEEERRDFAKYSVLLFDTMCDFCDEYRKDGKRIEKEIELSQSLASHYYNIKEYASEAKKSHGLMVSYRQGYSDVVVCAMSRHDAKEADSIQAISDKKALIAIMEKAHQRMHDELVAKLPEMEASVRAALDEFFELGKINCKSIEAIGIVFFGKEYMAEKSFKLQLEKAKVVGNIAVSSAGEDE